MRRGALCFILLLAAFLLGTVALTACEQASPTTSSSPPSSTSTTPAPSGQELLDRAVAWIEAAPTEVTFGPYPYTVIYSRGAAIGRLTLPASVQGEPIVPWPNCWWAADTDYYFGDKEGPTKHVTPAMAMSMRTAPYSGGGTNSGISSLVIIRCFADPHRLLAKSEATSAAEETDGTWKIAATTTARALVDLDLPVDELARYIGPDFALDTTLEVGKDGSIRSMSMKPDHSETDVWTYVWTRIDEEPALPQAWVDLDDYTLQKELESGWRASPSDAAQDVDFPVYWLGDSYGDVPLRWVHVEVGRYVLLEYGTGRNPATAASAGQTTSTVTDEGYILFEYSESQVPESEKQFVADKTLLATVGEGSDTYSVYTTAKGKPGRSVLVKKGETYISIDLTGGGTGDATNALLAAAAALQRVAP